MTRWLAGSQFVKTQWIAWWLSCLVVDRAEENGGTFHKYIKSINKYKYKLLSQKHSKNIDLSATQQMTYCFEEYL